MSRGVMTLTRWHRAHQRQEPPGGGSLHLTRRSERHSGAGSRTRDLRVMSWLGRIGHGRIWLARAKLGGLSWPQLRSNWYPIGTRVAPLRGRATPVRSPAVTPPGPALAECDSSPRSTG